MKVFSFNIKTIGNDIVNVASTSTVPPIDPGGDIGKDIPEISLSQLPPSYQARLLDGDEISFEELNAIPDLFAR